MKHRTVVTTATALVISLVTVGAALAVGGPVTPTAGDNTQTAGLTTQVVGPATEGWGTLPRNTSGSPTGVFRAGPEELRDGATLRPPHGIGSLGITLADDAQGPAIDSQDRYQFTTSTYLGTDLSTINQANMGMWVFEGNVSDALDSSVPNVNIEIFDPTTNYYTSIVSEVGLITPENRDGTDNTGTNRDIEDKWLFWNASEGTFRTTKGGSACHGGGCTLATVIADIQANNAGSVPILSVGINKGRDNGFSGAVDGFVFDNTVFDFEPVQQGPAGSGGAAGAAGPAGANGPTGATGPAGPGGPAGADGTGGTLDTAEVPAGNRLGGATRTETAIAVSQFQFPDGSRDVYLAREDVPFDAQIAGALTNGPIMLVPSCDGLPQAVADEISRLAPDNVLAIGQGGAVCDATLEAAIALS